ncbi:pilin assembly protein, partial [Pseudomonas aeruginosa]|nr:pilin assembly protein [Pseudomonas aeruginosa]
MKIRELVRHWEHTAKGRMARNHYSIPLDVESAARLAALHEMYPRR